MPEKFGKLLGQNVILTLWERERYKSLNGGDLDCRLSQEKNMGKGAGESPRQSCLLEESCVHLSIPVMLSNWPEAAIGQYGLDADGDGYI